MVLMDWIYLIAAFFRSNLDSQCMPSWNTVDGIECRFDIAVCHVQWAIKFFVRF